MASTTTQNPGAGSSGGGNGNATAADSYVGSLISLTSKSEIRYEGILYNINTDESSIGLRNVRSFGTEGRKKDGPQLPPGEKVYEYILFRGSDIKDLQVKSSTPTPSSSTVNNDPAIIQSHYSRPVNASTSLPSAVTGSLPDPGSHGGQTGASVSNFKGGAPGSNFQGGQTGPPEPNFQGGAPESNFQGGQAGSNFQGGLPLYQPGGNWGAPPNGIPMPMYWQGYYGPPSNMHQQSLLRPPAGLSVPPSQMQFPNFNAAGSPPNFQTMNLPIPNFSGSNLTNSNLPGSNLPTSNSTGSNLPTSSFSGSNMPTSNLPSSNLPSFNFPGSKLPISNLPTLSVPSSNLPVSNLPTSTSLPTYFPSPNLPTGLNFPSLNSPTLPEFPSSLLSASSSSSSTTSTSLPPVTTVPPVSFPTASEPLPGSFSVLLSTKAPLTTSAPELTAIVPPIASRTDAASSFPIPGNPNSVPKETRTAVLVTPNQLQSGPAIVPSSQSASAADKDVEIVQVSSAPSEESSPVSTEAQPPLLPLPVPSRAAQQPNGTPVRHQPNGAPVRGQPNGAPVNRQPNGAPVNRQPNGAPVHRQPKGAPVHRQPNGTPVHRQPNGTPVHRQPNGTPFRSHHDFRGRERGGGAGRSRPIAKFTEDFDFEAMNEKFNKDEVWGDMGKSKSKDKDDDGKASVEDYSQHDVADMSKAVVYNKDDFFDTLSSNNINHESQNGRTKFSEQVKIDTETFGDFSRYRRGGRGGGYIHGGPRGGYYGRGYGYGGRGRGRGPPNYRAS